MTLVTNEIVKKVFKDWHTALPMLAPGGKNKLHKIIGPFVLGVELIRSRWGDDYSPYIVLYSLWGNKMGTDIKSCLSGPKLLLSLRRKKLGHYNIPYLKNEHYLIEAVASTKEQLIVPLTENVRLDEMLKLFEDKLDHEIFATDPAAKASLCECMFNSCLYVGNVSRANETISLMDIVRANQQSRTLKKLPFSELIA
jgi:hypothetical protein